MWSNKVNTFAVVEVKQRDALSYKKKSCNNDDKHNKKHNIHTMNLIVCNMMGKKCVGRRNLRECVIALEAHNTMLPVEKLSEKHEIMEKNSNLNNKRSSNHKMDKLFTCLHEVSTFTS